MKSQVYLPAILLICWLFVSCSSKETAVMPSGEELSGNVPIVSESTNPSETKGNPYRNLFGAWKVLVDTENMTTEIIPARNAHAIGDIFDADLLQFLTVSPCANCLRITSMEFDHLDLLRMDIGIKHPFSNITSRPDLHGFDVRLIFIYAATGAVAENIMMMHPDGTEEPASLNAWAIFNSDGLTPHYDSIVTDERYFLGGSDIPGNLNPFIRYFEDFTTDPFDPHNPVGYNVMPTGSDFEIKTAQFGQFGMGVFELYLIADVAYGQSATYLNRSDPQYYLPWFNRTEPWRVEYWLENNNFDDLDPTSTADMVVQVFDWQHNAAVDPAFPDPANLSGLRESSGIQQLELEVYGFQETPIIVTTPESGTGTPDDPLQYRMQITDETGANRNQIGLLAIRDEHHGKAYPDGGRMPIPELPAGFPYDTEDIRDYTLYQVVYVNYPDPDDTYLNELKLNPGEQYGKYGYVYLSPTYFMDPAGSRFLYQWDYNYDGVTFDIDGEGYASPKIEYLTGGQYDVGVKITLNTVPPKEYIYTIPVWIGDEVFQKNLDSTVMTKKDYFSVSRSAAIGMSSDYYYCVFSSEAGIRRNIYLVVGDKTGFFTSRSITSVHFTTGCFYPVILPIEDGINDRLIIIFNVYESGNWNLYSTWGNLDGTGFEASHIEQIGTTRKYNSWVDVYDRFGVIQAYYWSGDSFLDANIEIAYTSDYADTWTVHPTLIDSGSNAKFDPQVVYNEPSYQTFVVWSDFRNAGTTGGDIYMASSPDGLTFTSAENISGFPGLVNEYSPEAASHGSTIAIAYLVDLDGLGNKKVYLKLMEASGNSMIDYWVDTGSHGNIECTKPGVGMAVNNRITVAYGTYNDSTQDLRSIVVELEARDGFFNIRQNQLYNEIIGTSIDQVVVNQFPGSGVQCRSFLGGRAYESFVVWQTYDDGATYRTDPINQYMGDIQCIDNIRDGSF